MDSGTMAKLSATQLAVLRNGNITGSSFAMTTAWFDANNVKVTAQVKALIGKGLLRRKALGGGSFAAVLTEEGTAAVANIQTATE